MTDEIKKEFRGALWKIIGTGVFFLAVNFVQMFVSQKTMGEQLDVLRTEQQLIRAKVDLLQVQMERKVNRDKMDDCFDDVKKNIEIMNETVLSIYRELKN